MIDEQTEKSNRLVARKAMLDQAMKPFKQNPKEAYKNFIKIKSSDLKAKSDEFQHIYRYVESTYIFDIALGRRGVGIDVLKKIIIHITALLSSRLFCDMDLEPNDTDQFTIVIALYVALCFIHDNYTERLSKAHTERYKYAASELGVRLLTRFIDKRV